MYKILKQKRYLAAVLLSLLCLLGKGQIPVNLVKAKKIEVVDSLKLGGIWYKSFGASSLDTSIQWSVIDSLSAPDTSAVIGNIYLVGTSPTGAFAGHAKTIATFGGVSYTFQSGTIGDLLFNTNTSIVSKFTGIAWVRVGKAIIHQGGDKYGNTVSVGTNDNFPLSFKTNGIERLNFDGSGNANLKNGNFNVVNGNLNLNAPYPAFPFIYFNGASGNTSLGYDASSYFQFNYGGGRFKFSDGTILSQIRHDQNYFLAKTKIGNDYDPPNSAYLTIATTKYGFLPPRVNTAQMNLINEGVATGTITNGGSGYTNGTYAFILLTGGSLTAFGEGVGGTATVSGGAVTSIGISYSTGQAHVGDILSINYVPGGTGFQYTVNSVLPPANGVMVYNTDSAANCYYNGSAWVKIGGGGGTTTAQVSQIVHDSLTANQTKLSVATQNLLVVAGDSVDMVSKAAHLILRSGDSGGKSSMSAMTVQDLPSGTQVITIAANSTDGDFTAVVNTHKYLPAATLTANRTITMPTATNGDRLRFFNDETNGFIWLLSGSSIYYAGGITIMTQLPIGALDLEYINSKWRIIN